MLEEEEIFENLENLGKNVFLGLRTDYIYYYDLENRRFMLIGVNKKNINQNNYFDGIFDQIPPKLNLREKLYLAYPYVQINGGLDNQGFFLNKEHTRVGISPYFKYSSFEDVFKYLEVCKTNSLEYSEFLICLTHESKEDKHLDFPELFFENGTLKYP